MAVGKSSIKRAADAAQATETEIQKEEVVMEEKKVEMKAEEELHGDAKPVKKETKKTAKAPANGPGSLLKKEDLDDRVVSRKDLKGMARVGQDIHYGYGAPLPIYLM